MKPSVLISIRLPTVTKKLADFELHGGMLSKTLFKYIVGLMSIVEDLYNDSIRMDKPVLHELLQQAVDMNIIQDFF